METFSHLPASHSRCRAGTSSSRGRRALNLGVTRVVLADGSLSVHDVPKR